MNWLYLSLISALGFSLLSIFSRVVSVESKNPRALSVSFNIIAITLALFLFFVTSSHSRFSLPKDPYAYFYLLLACLFFGLYERIRFHVAKLVEASLLALINNISLVVAFIVSLFIYGESVTVSKVVGFLLIVFSLVLVSFKKVKKINWKGISIALLSNVFIGVAWALDKKVVKKIFAGVISIIGVFLLV